ncbi:hypothetical protein CCR75_005043 [Bremia lactucae]|uniref:Multicopper oxidase n=1 Tax=Bremia lactucae TaxID=4779 RepID=A0A976FME3_BRELC|nr:hypothetical protein CCR75_005043 [Bremia lactucae]
MKTSELRVDLAVKVARFRSNYVNFNTRSYNGHIPAPTIKVCPGDRLILTLTNLLEAGSNNNTNVHLHGMHLSPMGDADNVVPNVKPKGQRRYTYDIRRDHPAGTFWYHPHSHGNSNSQLNGMMAGALIVVDRPRDFPADLMAMEDLVLLLQALCIENCLNPRDNLQEAIENKQSSHHRRLESGAGVWNTDLRIVEDDADVPLNDTSLPTVFVNGQYLPTLQLSVGQYKRLRFVNAIANNVAELVTTYQSGCVFTVLAMDGIYYEQPKAKNVIVIPPGGRADLSIVCSEMGTFYIETDCASSRNSLLGLVNQHRVPSQRIVKLEVAHQEIDDADVDFGSPFKYMRLPTTLPKRPAYMDDTIGTPASRPMIEKKNQHDFEFSVWMEENLMYGVNHKKLDMTQTTYSMPVNEMQQWEISIKDYRKESIWNCNLIDNHTRVARQLTAAHYCHTMSHPFHMHSTHFQVSDMDDTTDPDGILFDVGEWRDTLPLFRGGVQIRFTPREYMVGNILAHCHFASHVDAGMAELINVYDSSTRVNSASKAEEMASDVSGEEKRASDADEEDKESASDEEEEDDSAVDEDEEEASDDIGDVDVKLEK